MQCLNRNLMRRVGRIRQHPEEFLKGGERLRALVRPPERMRVTLDQLVLTFVEAERHDFAKPGCRVPSDCDLLRARALTIDLVDDLLSHTNTKWLPGGAQLT